MAGTSPAMTLAAHSRVVPAKEGTQYTQARVIYRYVGDYWMPASAA